MHQIIEFIRTFCQQYTFFAIAVLLIIVVCLIRSPKETLKFSAVLAVLGVAIYFLMQVGGTMTTGVGQKEKMINKTRDALE